MASTVKMTSSRMLIFLVISICCIVLFSNADATSGTVSSQGYIPGFGVALQQSQSFTASGSTAPVLMLTKNLANYYSSYSFATGRFCSRTTAQYFNEICTGIQSGSSVELASSGGSPSIYYTWNSTQQNGVVSGCRTGVSRLPLNADISLKQISGAAYSDASNLLSWSLFSLDDLISNSGNTLVYATGTFASGDVPIGTSLPLSMPVVNPQDGRYDNTAYTYTCKETGIYFFSMSVGIPAGNFAQLQLFIQNRDGSSDPYEMDMMATATTDTTTVSRNVLTYCNAQSTVTVKLLNGHVTSGSAAQSLASFTAFQYLPPQTNGKSAAWSLFSNKLWNTKGKSLDPLPMGILVIMPVNVGFTYSTVTITISGYYYVYVSVGTQPNQPCSVTLRKSDGSVVFGVRRLATNLNDVGPSIIGHGAVVQLFANDRLRVVGEPNSSGFSTYEGAEASFFGMLIHAL